MSKEEATRGFLLRRGPVYIAKTKLGRWDLTVRRGLVGTDLQILISRELMEDLLNTHVIPSAWARGLRGQSHVYPPSKA